MQVAEKKVGYPKILGSKLCCCNFDKKASMIGETTHYLPTIIATIITILKVLTNEKRGGLRVVSFDRSCFKLFSLLFSNKSMQAPSCERHKTVQRTLFLLFANNNCFPTSDEKLLALFEFRRFFFN